MRARRAGRDSRFSTAPARTPADARCITCGAAEDEVPLITTGDGFQCLPCEAVQELEEEVNQAQEVGASTAWAWALSVGVIGLPAWLHGLAMAAVWLGLPDLSPVRAFLALDLGTESWFAFFGYLWFLITIFVWPVGGYVVLTGLREGGRWLSPAAPALNSRSRRIVHAVGAVLAVVVGLATMVGLPLFWASLG